MAHRRVALQVHDRLPSALRCLELIYDAHRYGVEPAVSFPGTILAERAANRVKAAACVAAGDQRDVGAAVAATRNTEAGS